MAEWGKGDDRWIVENRQDGANVNQWHWSEKDCMQWSTSRFTELFADCSLVDDSVVKARVASVDSVEGEAFLNVRKKKLIPSYELKLTLAFTADVQKDGSETVTGKVVLPYIAEENHDEEPEVQVKPELDTPASRAAKDAIYNSRKQCIFPLVTTFVEEFHAGKPAGHSDNSGASSKPVVIDHTATAKSAPASVPATTLSKPAGAGQEITIEEKFYAGSRDLYEALTDEGRIKAFTQSDASVSREVGGKFTMFGGSIEGTQRELVPGKRIVQDWRFNTWPDGVTSTVTIEISEPEPGHTHVKLTQVGIPHEDKFGNHDVARTTEHGWRNLIFHRIRAVFGFGL